MECFGAVAEAPEGIRRLREMVLSRAIRGGLSERTARDGLSSKQVEELRSAFHVLIASNQFRANKAPGDLYEDLRWAIPKHWCWTRLDQVGSIGPRNKLSDDTSASFVPMPSVPEGFTGDISETELRAWQSIKKQYTHIADGDVVVAKITPCFQNRKSTVVSGLTGGVGAGTTELYVFRPADAKKIDARFILIWAKSPEFVASGVSLMTGTAGQQRVPRDYFAASPFPFPPLAEQKRIVAKVDQLMSMLDDLEQRQEKKRTFAIHGSKASLDSLVNAEDPDELARAWERVSKNFGTLTAAQGGLDTIREAIQSLALSGSLATDDPRDGSALDLLARIKEETEDAIKNKLTRRLPLHWNRPDSQLPARWTWVRLGDLLVFGPRNGFSPRPVEHETPVKSLTLSATTNGYFDESCIKFVEIEVPLDSPLWLRSGDILVQRGNTIEHVGVSAVYHGSNNNFIYPDLMMKIRVADAVDVGFVHLAMNCRRSRDYLRLRASGTSETMPKINQAAVAELPLPLPPVEEQRRVVAKVSHLLKLIDEVKHRNNQHTKAVTDLWAPGFRVSGSELRI